MTKNNYRNISCITWTISASKLWSEVWLHSIHV